jgi:hypothetical protein
MPLAYYELLGHVYVASHEEAAGALRKIGFTGDRIDAGQELAARVEEDIDHAIKEALEDRILEHSVHSSANEVEMWLQTVRFRLRKSELSEDMVERAVGAHLHPEDHTLAIVAQALRLIAMARTHEEIQEALGGARKTADVIQRGSTLLEKLYKISNILLDPTRTLTPDDAPPFQKLDDDRGEMEEWLGALTDQVEDADEKYERDLGLVGFVPEDVGLPLGGTAYSVVLHERATSEAPDPERITTTSGWSAGRQGRNRENLGKGWVVEGDDGEAEAAET